MTVDSLLNVADVTDAIVTPNDDVSCVELTLALITNTAMARKTNTNDTSNITAIVIPYKFIFLSKIKY